MAKKDAYEERISKPVPEGTHNARLLSIIDCGTQAGAKPEYAANPKLLFNFELVDTNEDFGKGFDEPFTKSKSFNPIITTKKDGTPSKYKAFLQSLLNRVIEKGEAITRSSLVGLACKAIFVEEDDPKDPKKKVVKFDKIKSVDPEVGKTFAKLRNPKIYFEIPAPGEEAEINCKYAEAGSKVVSLHWTDCFLKLYPWQQKLIVKSPEFIKACAVYGVEITGEGDAMRFVDARKKSTSTASGAAVAQDDDDQPF